MEAPKVQRSHGLNSPMLSAETKRLQLAGFIVLWKRVRAETSLFCLCCFRYSLLTLLMLQGKTIVDKILCFCFGG